MALATRETGKFVDLRISGRRKIRNEEPIPRCGRHGALAEGSDYLLWTKRCSADVGVMRVWETKGIELTNWGDVSRFSRFGRDSMDIDSDEMETSIIKTLARYPFTGFARSFPSFVLSPIRPQVYPDISLAELMESRFLPLDNHRLPR